MTYSRIAGFLSMVVLFALVLGVVSSERSFAQAPVEILATDLAGDPTTVPADERKTASTKVSTKIAGATAGAVVTFPSGEFKDVGEIRVVDKSGTAGTAASGSTAAVAAKPITLRGNGTVFTGKIMINVQDSSYITIEGFTFKDTQAPDTVTVAPGTTPAFTAGATDDTATRIEDTGVIWLNTAVTAASAACPDDVAMKPVNNIIVRDNMFMNTARHGVLARAKAAPGTLDPSANYAQCDSSAVTISDNTFVGIGMGPNAVYLDSAKTVPGLQNRESAIEGDKTYGWTVSDNKVGFMTDGTEAAGTTANGIRLDRAFGKTVVRNNMINNAAWSGIVVGGDGSTGDDDAADADEAEITIANNTVTNSRNDPYITSWWESATPAEGYVVEAWRFSAERLQATPLSSRETDEFIDELLKATVWSLPTGHTAPFLGDRGEVRRVDGILPYSSGTRTDTDPSGMIGEPDKIADATVVRWLKAGLEAGLELNRLTAKTLTVENNELTGNVVGLVVCPASYCYADDPYGALTGDTPTPPATNPLKVPTLTANRIYDNMKRTDMPGRFARADVVNALTTTNTGTGSNVLILKGNYLGDNPEIRGAVNDDDLAMMDDANVGPKERVAPALPDTGGATFTGTTVTLTYGEALDGESVPAAAAFTVTQEDSDGLSAAITVSEVEIDGMNVILTLAKAPGSGNSVTVSYDPTKAGSGTGVGPIQDAAGNAAAAIGSRMVAAAPVEPPEEPMMPEEPMTGGGAPPAAAGDGGCALASGGGGADLGVLLPMMLVMFVFGLGRNVRKKS